jgi:hypothetical protein
MIFFMSDIILYGDDMAQTAGVTLPVPNGLASKETGFFYWCIQPSLFFCMTKLIIFFCDVVTLFS